MEDGVEDTTIPLRVDSAWNQGDFPLLLLVCIKMHTIVTLLRSRLSRLTRLSSREQSIRYLHLIQRVC
jgi:hypothetical protein